MSKRTPSIVISDILRCIEHIEIYTAKLSFDEFSNNFMVIEACLYNIQIIGEAVNQLADDVKDENPQLIHEYFGTDLPLVWNTIKNDLPGFTSELGTIRNQLVKGNR